MRDFFKALDETMENGLDAVIVSIVASSGSTPRGAGARMLVTRDGRICGTIGGGAVEYHSEKVALEVLQTKKSVYDFYQLHSNDIQDLGMICGGDVHVYFRYLPANDSSAVAVSNAVEELFTYAEPAWLIEEITPEKDSGIGVFSEKTGLLGIDISSSVLSELKSGATKIEDEGRTFYCEKIIQSGKVYIFGGGHVAQALVPALTAVNFRCTVLEDREDFCRSELFGGYAETKKIDNNHVLDYVKINENDYVIIMTRGHKDDQLIESQVLKTPARYIGVIGSRRKAAGVAANLKMMGFTDEDLSRITTPIGLAIKAETPAEIAVSITAQLIENRALMGK